MVKLRGEQGTMHCPELLETLVAHYPSKMLGSGVGCRKHNKQLYQGCFAVTVLHQGASNDPDSVAKSIKGGEGQTLLMKSVSASNVRTGVERESKT